MIIPLYRKEQIYELAQKYNFLILEDDPYYYLQVNIKLLKIKKKKKKKKKKKRERRNNFIIIIIIIIIIY